MIEWRSTPAASLRMLIEWPQVRLLDCTNVIQQLLFKGSATVSFEVETLLNLSKSWDLVVRRILLPCNL